MERYTEKPLTQGERRTDNTPAPVKTQKGKEGAVKNRLHTGSDLHSFGMMMGRDIAYLTGRER
jgi:hypothetical protein